MPKDNTIYEGKLSEFLPDELEIFEGLIDFDFRDRFQRCMDKIRKEIAPNANGKVILVINEDKSLCIQHNGKHELFHTTPYHRHSGFIWELVQQHHPDALHPDDVDYILEAAELEGFDIPPPWSCLKIDRILEHPDAVEE